MRFREDIGSDEAQTGCRGRDEEAGDPARPLRAVGRSEDAVEVGDSGVRDEALHAVEHPGVGRRAGRRGDRADVRAGLRLGHREAGDRPPGGDHGQPSRALSALPASVIGIEPSPAVRRGHRRAARPSRAPRGSGRARATRVRQPLRFLRRSRRRPPERRVSAVPLRPWPRPGRAPRPARRHRRPAGGSAAKRRAATSSSCMASSR